MLRIALHLAMIAVAFSGVFWTWLACNRPQFVRRGFAWQGRPHQPQRGAMPHLWAFEAFRWTAGSGFVLGAWLVLDGLFSWIGGESLAGVILFAAIFLGCTAFLLVESVADSRDVDR